MSQDDSKNIRSLLAMHTDACNTQLEYVLLQNITRTNHATNRILVKHTGKPKNETS